MMAVVLIDPSNYTIPYDLELLRALREEGVKVTLACRWERASERQMPPALVDRRFYRTSERLMTVRWLHGVGKLVKALEHLVDSARLLSSAEYRNATLHYQWLVVPVVDHLVLRLFRRGRALVVTMHDTEPLKGSIHSRWQIWGVDKVLRAADRVIVHTDQGCERLIQIGVERERISVLRHPVLPLPAPVAGDLPVRVAEWWNAPTRYLLFGHLKAYKGIDTLLEALQLLDHQERGGIKVLLAGKSAFGDNVLEEKIWEHGLSDVVCLENRFLPDGELSAIVRHANGLLFPYLQIDASGALLLVLPLGLPIVLSKLPGILQSIGDYDRVFYVRPGNVQDLTDAIRSMTGKLAAGCFQMPAHVHRIPGWEQMAQELRAIYLQTGMKRVCRAREQ